jgi:hypothetical protein
LLYNRSKGSLDSNEQPDLLETATASNDDYEDDFKAKKPTKKPLAKKIKKIESSDSSSVEEIISEEDDSGEDDFVKKKSSKKNKKPAKTKAPPIATGKKEKPIQKSKNENSKKDIINEVLQSATSNTSGEKHFETEKTSPTILSKSVDANPNVEGEKEREKIEKTEVLKVNSEPLKEVKLNELVDNATNLNNNKKQSQSTTYQPNPVQQPQIKTVVTVSKPTKKATNNQLDANLKVSTSDTQSPLGRIELKTSSPCIRVGLSRKSKYKPLHPNVKPNL